MPQITILQINYSIPIILAGETSPKYNLCLG